MSALSRVQGGLIVNTGGGARRGGSGGGRGRDGSRGRGSGEAGRRGGDGRAPRRGGGPGPDERRQITVQPGGTLPKWVREEVLRSTPKDRREAALAELSTGLTAFADERFRQSAVALRKAKALAPRSSTVRELLGLSAYQLEAWEEALRELRTFRRLTGETSHMAVEIDCLRALGRDRDIEKAWETFGELGGDREAEDEIRVVYASHLLDQGRVAAAWKVIKPGRLVADPTESTLRRWAVAARVAAAAGDTPTATTVLTAIRRSGGGLTWLSDLESELGM